MIPLHWITGLFAVTAGLVFLLPEDLWLVSLLGLVSAYLVMIAWGTNSLTSSLLGPCLTRGPDAPRFALTFDDGPDPEGTSAVLDLLAERRVPATFFCIGRHIEAHPEIAQRIHDEGHLIGNHSFTHKISLTFANPSRLTQDLTRCQDAIEACAGYRPRFFRPPFGLRTHSTHAAATRNDMRVIGWSAGGLDTTSRSTDAIAERCLAALNPGAIVLLHDHGPASAQTLEVVRRILDEAEQRGLQAVRLDALFPQ